MAGKQFAISLKNFGQAQCGTPTLLLGLTVTPGAFFIGQSHVHGHGND